MIEILLEAYSGNKTRPTYTDISRGRISIKSHDSGYYIVVHIDGFVYYLAERDDKSDITHSFKSFKSYEDAESYIFRSDIRKVRDMI